MRLFFNLILNKLQPIFIAFTFTISLIANVNAADSNGDYLVMGLGNLTCNSFLTESKEGTAYYLSWLAGYMTAYNHLQGDTYSIMGKTKTIDQIETWLQDYCAVNGHESFESAIRNLLNNLKHFRIKQKP